MYLFHICAQANEDTPSFIKALNAHSPSRPTFNCATGYIPVYEGYISFHGCYTPVHVGYIPVHAGYIPLHKVFINAMKLVAYLSLFRCHTHFPSTNYQQAQEIDQESGTLMQICGSGKAEQQCVHCVNLASCLY
jgi:hypothetical protein